MRNQAVQRGKTWSVYYELPRTETDPDTGRAKRKRTSKGGFATEREAKAWLAAEMTRLNRGEYVEPSAETLAGYLAGWLEIVEREIRPTTLLGYRLMVEKQINPRIGHVPLQKLTVDHFDNLYTTLLKEGHRQREGGLSARTVRYCHTIVRKALADAVKKRKLTHNPADAASPPKGRAAELASRKKRTFWDGQQLGRFLAQTKEHRLHVAFHLAAMTGMRRGELLGLRWSDLDLEEGRLRVEQTLLAPRYVLALGEPKTELSKRTITLDPGTVAVLKEHRKRQIEERMAFGKGWGEHPLATDLMFRDELGGPVIPALFSLAFQDQVKEAGLPKANLHSLRHTHAALLGKAGVPAKVVQERLGHHSAAFTLDNYGGTFPSQHQDAAEKFAALVASNT